MAILPDGRLQGNGPKKTRQGKGKNTKFGKKPQTHTGMFPSTKAIKRYKKKSRGQGS
jgi:hypothetical protein